MSSDDDVDARVARLRLNERRAARMTSRHRSCPTAAASVARGDTETHLPSSHHHLTTRLGPYLPRYFIDKSSF